MIELLVVIAMEMIDWPATYHNLAGGLHFGDGHSEIHRWLDPRTQVHNGNVSRMSQNGSVDIAWLQQHTSAPSR